MKVTIISSQTSVAAESRLKYILLNRGFERLKHPEKCGETTEKKHGKMWKNTLKTLGKM